MHGSKYTKRDSGSNPGASFAVEASIVPNADIDGEMADDENMQGDDSDYGDYDTPWEVYTDASHFTDSDVLTITGPAGWTLTIFDALSRAAGTPITWHNLTGLREPRLYGDILVLPIDAFATGLEHSGSTLKGSPDALVRHGFRGSWKGWGQSWWVRWWGAVWDH
jgi:hypothetical protein